MQKQRESFVIRHEFEELLSQFSDAMAGKLFKALMYYSIHGIDPEISGGKFSILYIPMRNAIKRDIERYEEVSERNRKIAEKRWGKEKTEEESPSPPPVADGEMPTDANACDGMPPCTKNAYPNRKRNSNRNPDPDPNRDRDRDPNPDRDPDRNRVRGSDIYREPDGNDDRRCRSDPNGEPDAGHRGAADAVAKKLPPFDEDFYADYVEGEDDDDEEDDDELDDLEEQEEREEKNKIHHPGDDEFEYHFYGPHRNVKLSNGEMAVLRTQCPNEARRHIELLSKELKRGKTVKGSHYDVLLDRITAEKRVARNVEFY